MSVPYAVAPYSYTVQGLHPHHHVSYGGPIHPHAAAVHLHHQSAPHPAHVQMYHLQPAPQPPPPQFQYPPHTAAGQQQFAAATPPPQQPSYGGLPPPPTPPQQGGFAVAPSTPTGYQLPPPPQGSYPTQSQAANYGLLNIVLVVGPV